MADAAAARSPSPPSSSGDESPVARRVSRPSPPGGAVASAANQAAADFSRVGLSPRPAKPLAGADDTDPAWRARSKHIFAMSNAGKPIYSRYGSEDGLAGFMGSLYAMVSFVEGRGDALQHFTAGQHTFVFVTRGPFVLVAVSATGEPVPYLERQLSLLHLQLVAILTRGVEKAFERRATYDMRGLMGGTEQTLAQLVKGFTWEPGCYLSACRPLPLDAEPRARVQAALSQAVAQTQAEAQTLHAVLLTEDAVVGLASARRTGPIDQSDLLLLLTFVRSTGSFRAQESAAPVCLPALDPHAFVHCYVSYLQPSLCLVLVAAAPGAFESLRLARQRVEKVLAAGEAMDAVGAAMRSGSCPRVHVPRLPGAAVLTGDAALRAGLCPLWHFLYKSTPASQYVSPAFAPPLSGTKEQRHVLRAYQRLYYASRATGQNPSRVHYTADERLVLLACRGSDFELLAAFDPLTEKNTAVSACNRLCAYLRGPASARLFFQPAQA